MYELEDFDLEPAEYKVYATGYDPAGEEIEGNLLLGVDEDPEEAIRVAKLKADGFRKLVESGSKKWGTQELSLIMIRVETVIKLEGEEQFAGCLYEEGILVESDNKN